MPPLGRLLDLLEGAYDERATTDFRLALACGAIAVTALGTPASATTAAVAGAPAARATEGAAASSAIEAARS